MSMNSFRKKDISGWKFYAAMIIIFILVMVKAKAQPPEHVVDTNKMLKIVPPPDSVNIVSLRDYQLFFVWLQENTTKASYDKLKPEDVLSYFAQWAIVENEKKKKKK